ncbi:MAG: hypothetical protein EOR72_31305 [Mesorhizobium sp.]|uniref:hypothetical protein n=1 Tax=Mesorhizobium sp. TaxID=1871066 RepID=UPI000FE64204|nr:hypothetical protein [Mesorhizobium sp.]RWM06663.1 MAG: hypothetical protein EOR72_31305 [Mesorhizobium sp.]
MQQRAHLNISAVNNQNGHVFEARDRETAKNNTKMMEQIETVDSGDRQMRGMTRLEFEAYEKRVEAVLTSVEQSIDESDRASFEGVAEAAREVVSIRREYLEFSEYQANAGLHAKRDAIARHGEDAVRVGDELFLRIATALTTVETLREPQVRYDYDSDTYSMQETEATHDARMEKLNEAEKRYSELLERAAREALDGNSYIKEEGEKRLDIRFATNMEIWRREQVERNDRGLDGDRESGSVGAGTNNQNEGASGGFRGTADTERHRDPGQDVHSTLGQDDHVVEQPPTTPSGQRRYPDEQAAGRKPAPDAENARSDPPQQHVPRLRQIEPGLEEREDRDGDDREM